VSLSRAVICVQGSEPCSAAASFVSSRGDDSCVLPTVFRWDGQGRDVCISGSYDNWETKIPLVKRLSCTIEDPLLYHI